MRGLGGIVLAIMALGIAAPAAGAQGGDGAAVDEYVESLPGADGREVPRKRDRAGAANRSPKERARDRRAAKRKGGDEELLDRVAGATGGNDRGGGGGGGSAARAAVPQLGGENPPDLPSAVAGAVADPGAPTFWLVLLTVCTAAGAALFRFRHRLGLFRPTD